MPRYHFNVRDGQNYPDLQGSELADISAARIEAVKFAGQLLSDGAERFWSGDEWVMTVTNDRGLTLFTLTFLATLSPAFGL